MKSHDEIFSFACRALQPDNQGGAILEPLSARGSDRIFYRFFWDGKCAIVIDYDPARIENTFYADIALFLKTKYVPVPEVLAYDPQQSLMILEDLGITDLYSFGTQEWPARRSLYHKALGAVSRLHRIAPDTIPPTLSFMEGFGPPLYRFEHGYFLDFFIKGYCEIAIEAEFEQKLSAELEGLINRLGVIGKCLIHRDLQSQNIMIRDGNPFFIDFQGMRLGNPFYDLGSLLCDPYSSINPEDREELLSFYYVLSAQDMDWDLFRNNFWEASVQRLMQALGAYGFLGKVKGLDGFLRHIPSGLKNIDFALSHVKSLPALKDLIALSRFMLGNI